MDEPLVLVRLLLPLLPVSLVVYTSRVADLWLNLADGGLIVVDRFRFRATGLQARKLVFTVYEGQTSFCPLSCSVG